MKYKSCDIVSYYSLVKTFRHYKPYEPTITTNSHGYTLVAVLELPLEKGISSVNEIKEYIDAYKIKNTIVCWRRFSCNYWGINHIEVYFKDRERISEEPCQK